MTQDAGYSVKLGSISGGKIPLEPNSLQGDAVTPVTQKWLDDGPLLIFMIESYLVSKNSGGALQLVQSELW